MNYNTEEFLEIIRDVEGIKYVREELREGIRVAILEGVHSQMVIYDLSEEELDDDVGKGVIRSLGIHFMIGALFPAADIPVEQQN